MLRLPEIGQRALLREQSAKRVETHLAVEVVHEENQILVLVLDPSNA
jgi:hypothetical protein